MAEPVTRADFARHVNTPFVLRDSREDRLDLVQVSDAPSSHRQEVFSLLFRGPADRALAQGTWKMAHEALGDLDIFLVPVGQDGSGRYYEAVFNRLVPPDPGRA